MSRRYTDFAREGARMTEIPSNRPAGRGHRSTGQWVEVRPFLEPW